MPTNIDWGTEDLHIRREGRAGRITFRRPAALNALSHPTRRLTNGAITRRWTWC